LLSFEPLSHHLKKGKSLKIKKKIKKENEWAIFMISRKWDKTKKCPKPSQVFFCSKKGKNLYHS
jgi:hypothetical protein